MNILTLLGIDTNKLCGLMLMGVAVFFFIFCYVHWKRNEAWKRDKGVKTKFLQIWKPSALFGCILFLLLGLGFFFIDKMIPIS